MSENMEQYGAFRFICFSQQRRVLDGGIVDDSLMHGVCVMPFSPDIASLAAHCGLRK